MPLYNYHCECCGPFDALATIAGYKEPSTCPNCGGAAPRVLVSMPRLGTMDTATRAAHATNERSADSPRKSSHGPGCSCCSGTGSKISAGTLRRPDGSKSFPAKRPWMISH